MDLIQTFVMALITVFLLIIIAIIPAMLFQFRYRFALCKAAGGLLAITLICAFFVDNSSNKLFPQEQLSGGISSVRLTVKEHQRNKSVRGGQLVTANVLLPPTVKDEQMRPTEMVALKSLKEQFPDCEWFFVWFSNDQRLLDAGHYLGRAEYKEGKIELTGGVITAKDIKESDGGIWVPKEEDIQAAYEFYLVSRKLEKEHQDKIDSLYAGGKREAAMALGLKDPAEDSHVFELVGKNLNIPSEVISRRVKNVFFCYSITSFRKI